MNDWRTFAAVPRDDCTLDTLVRFALALGYNPAGVQVRGWHTSEGVTYYRLMADHDPDSNGPVILTDDEEDEEDEEAIVIPVDDTTFDEIVGNGHEPARVPFVGLDAGDDEADLPYPCEAEGCTRRFASARGMRRHLASHPLGIGGRQCAEPDCGTELSIYNTTQWCALHDPNRVSYG
jgi:hypothetical protein